MTARLAQLLTWLAGVVHRRRRDEWWADLLYEQKIEGQSALFQAAFCLLNAVVLATQAVARGASDRLRSRRRRLRLKIRGRDGQIEAVLDMDVGVVTPPELYAVMKSPELPIGVVMGTQRQPVARVNRSRIVAAASGRRRRRRR